MRHDACSDMGSFFQSAEVIYVDQTQIILPDVLAYEVRRHQQCRAESVGFHFLPVAACGRGRDGATKYPSALSCIPAGAVGTVNRHSAPAAR